MLFKLREAVVAVGDGDHRLMTIPHGAVVQLAGEPQPSGLVEVLWRGRHLAMFMQDIHSRAEKLGTVHAITVFPTSRA